RDRPCRPDFRGVAYRAVVDARCNLDRLPGADAVQHHAVCQSQTPANRQPRRDDTRLTRWPAESSARIAWRERRPCRIDTFICTSAAKATKPNKREAATVSMVRAFPRSRLVVMQLGETVNVPCRTYVLGMF